MAIFVTDGIWPDDIDETPTTRDLSWLDDANIAGAYYEATEGEAWDADQVAHVIRQHNLDPADFFAIEGDQPLYRAWAVLDWLNY